MGTTEWKWKTNDGLDMYSKAWLPSGKARGVVCLVHGVGEHIGRYQADGEALAEGGYILAGFDQRGFGKSGAAAGIPQASRLTLTISICSSLKSPGDIPTNRASCTVTAWEASWSWHTPRSASLLSLGLLQPLPL